MNRRRFLSAIITIFTGLQISNKCNGVDAQDRKCTEYESIDSSMTCFYEYYI